MAEYRLPSIEDFEDAEHCVLEDVTAEVPALDDALTGLHLRPHDVSHEFSIRDPLRGRTTSVRLYEGWADIESVSRGGRESHQRFNLSFIDPEPEISRYHPWLLLKIAGGFAALTALCAAVWLFGFAPAFTMPATAGGAALSFGMLFTFIYRSHQKFTFLTQHGRAEVLRLKAGFGTAFRWRRQLPQIINAINASARAHITEDSETLRAEMREHYRLRNDGVLNDDECADSTGRILARFDRAG
jgi:hypothetical protein